MAKYKVHVCRIGYSHVEFEVECATQQQAKEIAIEKAYDTVFSEKSSEYNVEGVLKCPD